MTQFFDSSIQILDNGYVLSIWQPDEKKDNVLHSGVYMTPAELARGIESFFENRRPSGRPSAKVVAPGSSVIEFGGIEPAQAGPVWPAVTFEVPWRQANPTFTDTGYVPPTNMAID